jgi:hypothetical protein
VLIGGIAAAALLFIVVIVMLVTGGGDDTPAADTVASRGQRGRRLGRRHPARSDARRRHRQDRRRRGPRLRLPARRRQPARRDAQDQRHAGDAYLPFEQEVSVVAGAPIVIPVKLQPSAT